MSDDTYWAQVSKVSAFADGIRLSTLKSTRGFFADVRPSELTPEIDWGRHLLAASLATVDAPETVQSGALRIIQGCLQDPEAPSEQKDAAEYLLRRLGNGRAAKLAHDKGLTQGTSDDEVAASPLSLDLIRRTLELSIDGGDERIPVNHFQRQFWSSAEESRWTSVSAPTSAGKSHIVRLWLATQIDLHDRYRAVYVVPTRALIDEVSRELEVDLEGRATVTTMPWDKRDEETTHEVFVLTQERLHILLRKWSDMTFDMIFVDEAQKLNDGTRGVLLQRTLDEAARRGKPKVIFASPLTSNPELLVDGVEGTSTALVSETVTVNQTLIHVNQRRTTRWDMVAFVDGDPMSIGEFDLPARPTTLRKRLSLVAVALGSAHSGNVVYTNGPGEAETVAGQICDALSSSGWVASKATLEVVELIEKTIHPQYLLATYLKQGVAFHYGNMPLLVREAVERLFRDGDVRYLVCTSTLLEGVNLPCQNLFVRAPRKGNNNLMSASDFWNLAGRAGRWGVEFQGNIVCVDTNVDGDWLEVPTRRSRQPMARATDAISHDYEALREYIDADTPVEVAREAPLLQALFGILASTRRQGLELPNLPWLEVPADQSTVLSDLVDEKLAALTVSPHLLQLHAGISALSIQRLHDHFQAAGNRDRFELPPPESFDAVDAYKRAIAVCNRFLGAKFGDHEGRQTALAILFVDWMKGRPLALLISNRLRYLRRKNKKYTLPAEIRSVLTDVEQYARFQGPLFLACYADVLDEAIPSDNESEPPRDIAMMMELGVSRITEVSMMSLGLSRTTVVALSDYITRDDLSPEQALEWIASRDISAYDLPALVVAEVTKVVSRRAGIT